MVIDKIAYARRLQEKAKQAQPLQAAIMEFYKQKNELPNQQDVIVACSMLFLSHFDWTGAKHAFELMTFMRRKFIELKIPQGFEELYTINVVLQTAVTSPLMMDAPEPASPAEKVDENAKQ